MFQEEIGKQFQMEDDENIRWLIVYIKLLVTT